MLSWFVKTVNESAGYEGESYLKEPVKPSFKSPPFPEIATFFDWRNLMPIQYEQYHVKARSQFHSRSKENGFANWSN